MSLQDNFKPPEAELKPGAGATPLWKALLSAFSLDIIGSLIAGVIMQEILLTMGYTNEQLQSMFENGFPTHIAGFFLILPGCLFSIGAGWLLIHLHRSASTRPPAILFGLQTLFSILTAGELQTWTLLAMSMLNLALVFGGWMLGYTLLRKKGVFEHEQS